MLEKVLFLADNKNVFAHCPFPLTMFGVCLIGINPENGRLGRLGICVCLIDTKILKQFRSSRCKRPSKPFTPYGRKSIDFGKILVFPRRISKLSVVNPNLLF